MLVFSASQPRLFFFLKFCTFSSIRTIVRCVFVHVVHAFAVGMGAVCLSIYIYDIRTLSAAFPIYEISIEAGSG